MLKITLPAAEMYDEDAERFIKAEECEICLEHSLYAISKWEALFERPFLNENLEKESFDYYIKCMGVPDDVPDDVLNRLESKDYIAIREYINKACTATKVYNKNTKPSKNNVITSEVIYYWMVEMGIPFQCDRWNLNRLLMLIEVCGVKNNPKKMNRKDIMLSNHELNKLRKAKWGTAG